MIKKFNNIIQRFKQDVVLSKNEKERLWGAVDAYVYNHPEREVTIPSRGLMHVLSPYFIHTQRMAILSIAMVFIVGGGTSLMAQDALPNDALYAIKVNVNEEVRSWFTFGAESRAYFETKRAGERLEEAKTLAVLGELDTQSKDKIKKNFEKHAHKVQEQIAIVETNNDLAAAIDISENFENSLKEHTKSLVKIANVSTPVVSVDFSVDSAASVDVVSTEPVDTITNAKQIPDTDEVSLFSATEIVQDEADVLNETKIVQAPDTNTSNTDELIDLVDAAQKNIDASVLVREEVEAKISTVADEQTRKTAAENKRADANTQIEKVTSLIATTTLSVEAKDIVVASSTLGTAKEFVVEGDTKLEAHVYGDAFMLFKQGFDTAVRAEHILVPPVTSKDIPTRNK